MRASSAARLERGELLAEIGDRLGQHAATAHVADVLAEVADGQPARPLDHALVRRLLAGHQAKQRGLAGAVGPDQPDLLAWIELERRIDEQDLGPVLLADGGERDHAAPGRTTKADRTPPLVAPRAPSRALGVVASISVALCRSDEGHHALVAGAPQVR